uniref:Bm688 n=1 Tax=Brugia malayi TaxID=6279 RepID=A0A0H5SB26_BRUMA|nr:Bm688 [Brugia malayi]
MAENEKILLKKIFKKESYDYSSPSESPTIVLPFMFIDHIEQLNQKQQLIDMHCSMLFHWTDKRIVWEPRDYGNVGKIVRQKSDLPRMWFPAVHFTERKLRNDQAMQYFNTQVTLISNGAVYAQVMLTIRSTCSLDFSAYPNDVHSCLLTMFTPLPLSKCCFTLTMIFEVVKCNYVAQPAELRFVYSESILLTDKKAYRLKFSRWTSLTKKSDIFGSLINELRTIRSGEFEVTNLSAALLFILPLGKITANESAERPEMMRSIIRFEIKFRRIVYYYSVTIALPLFCLATITFMVGTVVSPPSSIIWLLLCFAVQILNYTQMLKRLPPDQKNTPFCAKMATIMLAETLALIIYRVAITYKYNHSIGGKEISRCSRMQKIEKILRILFTLHTLLNAVLLFC